MLILGSLLWHTTGAGTVAPPEPPAPDVVAVQPSGGFPAHEYEPRTRRDISEARKRLGLDDGYEDTERALPVIEFVAARQAERLETDQQKIFEELLRELELERITFERRYLDALNLERQRLITEEIARRLRADIDDGELMLLMMVAAASA